MDITFITWYRFGVTLLAVILILALYKWLVRPQIRKRPEFSWYFDRSEALRTRVKEWLKVRWDLAVALFVALSPILWNGALDFIIFLSHIFTALSGTDLSALVMAPWLKTTLQISAAILPVVRSQILSWRGTELS